MSATLAPPSNRTLYSSAASSLTPTAPVKKPSPSPSIKRGKAEKLLKEHGSPPGMRVTAGGRIVPSDIPPVLSNRFVNSTFKPPAPRGIPLTSTMIEQQRTDTTMPRLEVIGSRPVLYVGDRAYALPALDATSAAAPPPPSVATESVLKPTVPASILSTQNSFSGAAPAPPRARTPTPSPNLDLSALKAQQISKRQELRTVEQTEVLQASQQTDAWRASIIEKKRNLIIELDSLRKQIGALESSENSKAPPEPSHDFTSSFGAGAVPMQPPAFVSPFQQTLPSSLYGYQGTPSYQHMIMFPPPFNAYPNMPITADAVSFGHNTVQVPQSPGSAGRRSHAIQIKPPPEETKKQISSALDPKSPTYQPVAKLTSTAKNIVPPTPSPNKQQSPWRVNGASQSDHQDHQTLSQKPSLSSIDTTDFFPTNTHEHSSTRVAPQNPEARSSTNETSAVPSTPEKNWPASPWNEGTSGRSSHKTVPKLTSWPEAFGKQPSSGSLRQVVTAQASTATQDRDRLISNKPITSALSGDTSERDVCDPRFGTDETWPLLHSKPVTHVPSTYQEGFQAGYDHVGIPDSPDVLKGYVQGLLQFLHDESKKGRNNSLRGSASSTQHQDSAISMSFNRTDAHVNSQENIRSAKANPTAQSRGESAYLTPDSPLMYAPHNDPSLEQRTHDLTPHMCINVSGGFDKLLPAHQTALRSTGNGLTKIESEKSIMSRAEAAMLGQTFRQYSGNQPNNRIYGPPLSLQRYSQTAKDHGVRHFGGHVPSPTRPMAHQRVSGLDGAMDDLAEMVADTNVHEQAQTQLYVPPFSEEGERASGGSQSLTSAEEDVSCFRPSVSKGKQKGPSSPLKLALDERRDAGASPSNASGSPKKSEEHSPAKVKLEHVTNKFKRKKKDPRNLSPEQKKERAKKWRERFGQLKDEDARAALAYKKSQSSGGERH